MMTNSKLQRVNMWKLFNALKKRTFSWFTVAEKVCGSLILKLIKKISRIKNYPPF